MSRPLDEAVAIETKEKQKELKQGRRVKFADPEPWPRPVEGRPWLPRYRRLLATT